MYPKTFNGWWHGACSIIVSWNCKDQKNNCIDGDGSLLMHVSGLQNSAMMKNFIHILINNGVYDSVGGQKINSIKLDYKQISKGLDMIIILSHVHLKILRRR